MVPVARLLQQFILLISIFLVTGLAAFSTACAEEARFGEYEVKAAFIYNIAKFVEWPSTHLPDVKSTLNLCILGIDPFGKALVPIEGKNVKNRRLRTKHIGSVREAKDCHILFISSSEKDQAGRIADTLKNTAVLTIGDVPGYGEQGVMINFYMDHNRVRFEINADKAKRSKVNISSQLLKLARIVSGGE